jgi:hypothetical protein
MSATDAALFDHVEAMTDERGMFEHARFDEPRPEHGYCTDDNARLLVVASREPDGGVVGRLGRVALEFVRRAMAPDGRVHNRMDRGGAFTDVPSTADCWGRAMWGLGSAASHHDDPTVQATASTLFRIGAGQRSTWPRSMAFAALGAADVLVHAPSLDIARALLGDAVAVIGRPGSGPWRWPEERLTYANASLAEALIAAGAGLGDDDVLDDGLTMLDWLLDRWTRAGHLSVTGVDGDGAGTGVRERAATRPVAFDQQPIEVGSLADACWRAYTLTSNRRWSEGVLLAERWFDGDNDAGTPMRDATSGGAFDGLEPAGVNRNQGAESTLALVSTRQRARSLVEVVR